MTRSGGTPSRGGRVAAALHALDGWSVTSRAILVIALLVTIIALDVVTGIELTLRPLYLLPVAAGSWLVGWRLGVLCALMSACACVLFDLQSPLVASQRVVLYTDGATRLVVYVVVSFLLARMRLVQEQLRQTALLDPLCAIPNRRGFEHLAERELVRARRLRVPTTVVLLDVDGFKALNDTHGHAAGDALLAKTAEVLSAGRASDLPARLGGDEFVLLLPETDARSAQSVVARLRDELAESVRLGGWAVSYSIGVATFAEPAPLAEMIRVADALMYETKRGGKNGATYRDVGVGSTTD